MAVVYSIRDWDENFEVSQSRKIDGPMNWVALTTKHDGKGFRRIMLLSDGLEIYGAWVLLVQIAAKCPTRGILADKDGPLDESDFHVKTGAPEVMFTKALSVLSSRQIGWLLVAKWEHAGSELPTPTEQTNHSCGDDATVTAKANGSEDGSQAREHVNGESNAGAASKATSESNGKCYPEAFEDFWVAYPTRGGRKRGKCKCLGMWRQAIRVAERQSLVEAAKAYAASDESTRGFARDPERFLAKDWWHDWIPAIAGQPAPAPRPAPPPEVPKYIPKARFS